MALESQSGRGKELADMLREELGIPKGVQWFEVRFAMDEPVTVKCQYIPQNPFKSGKRPDVEFE
jgi:hypothetical protein